MSEKPVVTLDISDRPPKVPVQLTGQNGNAYNLLGLCHRASRKGKWTRAQWDRFHEEATSGDYNHLLATMMEWFDVDGDEDDVEEDYNAED